MNRTDPRLRIHRLPHPLQAAGWDALLQGWATLLWRATDDEGDDVPYWYGERVLTGLLAAAAWKRRGGWALEEFTGRRGKRLKTKSGRGDLWLGLGQHEYTIEAKVKWPSSGPGYAIQYTQTALTAARRQLWKLSAAYRVGTLVALCYLVPCAMQRSRHDSPARLDAMIAALVRRFKGPRWLVASYVPNGEPAEDAGRVYRGVILVGKVVSWGAKHGGPNGA